MFLIFVINACAIKIDSPSPIAYHVVKIRKEDSFPKIFGEKFKLIARFNRMDKNQFKIGKAVKIPDDLIMLENWTPMPQEYLPAKNYEKYILVRLDEQFLGLYSQGKLVFDAPISSGRIKQACNSNEKKCSMTPSGFFKVLGGDKNHKSSLYKDPEGKPYPMDYAIRFYVNEAGVQYWLHRGELPGYPASHGCIRLAMEDIKKLFELVFEKYPEGDFWLSRNSKSIPVEIIN